MPGWGYAEIQQTRQIANPMSRRELHNALYSPSGAEVPEKRRCRKVAAPQLGRITPQRCLVPVPIGGDDCTAACTARALGGRWFQRNSSGKALAPFVRVARGMKYGVDRDRRFQRLVKHGIWKATYQRATVTLMNDGVNRGSTPDAFQTRIDRTQELLTQSGSASLHTRRTPLQCPTRLPERSPAQRA